MRSWGQSSMEVVIPDDIAALGMEARSILKSIQNEESKLIQSSAHLTRSDRHYFEARYNYYRLSLMRLQTQERATLEPFLQRFWSRLSETSAEDKNDSYKPAPFLTSVASNPPRASSPQEPAVPLPASRSISSDPVVPSVVPKEVIQDVVSQLGLVQLALQADLSKDSKLLLSEGVDRVIQRLRRL